MKQYHWVICVQGHPYDREPLKIINKGVDEMAQALGVSKVDLEAEPEAGSFISSPTGGAYRIPELVTAVVDLLKRLNKVRPCHHANEEA